MIKKHYCIGLLLSLILSLGLLISTNTGVAFAHAKVISATPGINSTVAQTPTTVTVTTAENINPDPKLSNLFVYGPSGELISQENARVSLNNPKQMSVSIKPEKDGVYVVRWTTVSAADGDPDQGAFVFTVKASASSQAAQKPASTTPTASANNNGGSPFLPAVISGIIALIIGLGIGFGLGKARPGQAASTTANNPERETNKI